MKKKNSNITIFAVLTTLTLVSWVFLEAYQRFYKKDLETVPPEIIAPLTPTLDTKYLDELEQKKQITLDEINSFKVSSELRPNSQSQQSTSTPSAQPSQSESTVSGETR